MILQGISTSALGSPLCGPGARLITVDTADRDAVGHELLRRMCGSVGTQAFLAGAPTTLAWPPPGVAPDSGPSPAAPARYRDDMGSFTVTGTIHGVPSRVLWEGGQLTHLVGPVELELERVLVGDVVLSPTGPAHPAGLTPTWLAAATLAQVFDPGAVFVPAKPWPPDELMRVPAGAVA